jgi:hypothetical protein
MVDVSRASFPEVLPRVLQDIEDAEFIALDFEFTGATIPPPKPR